MSRATLIRFFCLLLVSGCPLAIATLPAQDLSLTDTIPTVEDRAKIEALIQELGADKYRDRLRAESKLEEIGMAAIEPLQAVSPYADTEIRLRARRLAEVLRERFVNEGIPASLKSYFRGYMEMNTAARRSRLDQVVLQPISMTGGVLARLARFEDDEVLSKMAALAVLKQDLSDEEIRKRLLVGIQFSERTSCQWIRAYVESYNDVDQSLAKLQEMLKNEQKRVAVGSASTSIDVVDQLSQRVVDLLLRSGRQEKAYGEMRDRALAGKTPLQRLHSVDWLIDHKAWSTIDEIAESGKFEDNAMLVYRLAEAARLAGDEERALKLATSAFELGGKGIEDYPAIIAMLAASGQLSVEFRNPVASGDSTSCRRFLVARILESKRGLVDFAEREYKKVHASDDLVRTGGLYVSQIFSEMLHDLQRDNEAAAIRADAIERCVKKDKNFSDRIDPRYKSRMHYYLANHAKSEGRLEDEAAHLQDSLKVKADDIESLIAMYHAKGADEKTKDKNLSQIKKVSADYLRKIRAAELPAQFPRNRAVPDNGMMFNENQYAWLVCNTEGDIDEAIRRSEHTVREQPGDGGVLDTLARCYYAKGDFEKAVELQKQAVELEPHMQQLKRQLALFEGALEDSQNSEELGELDQSPSSDEAAGDDPDSDAETSD